MLSACLTGASTALRYCNTQANQLILTFVGIIVGKALKKHLELTKQIEKADTPFEIERLQDRLSKFVGGVAIVHVGGNTE